MLVTATAEVVRAMSVLFRRADAGLALGAARNAAAGVAVADARRFEEARTLRDLRRLDLPAAPTPESATSQSLRPGSPAPEAPTTLP